MKKKIQPEVEASSYKRQASSDTTCGCVDNFKKNLTMVPGDNDKKLHQLTEGVTRIANYIEEILLLVKKDQEASKKRWEKESE